MKKSTRSNTDWLAAWWQKTWVIWLLVLLCSFAMRLIGINKMGRTWDEYAYVGVGDTFLQLIRQGDFNNIQWYAFPDHPPVARYLYGPAGQLDIVERASDGGAVFEYDWTAPRVLSAFMGALAVAMVFLIGQKIWNRSTGVAAAILLALLPLAIAYSQLITLESLIVAISSVCIWSFLQYLETQKIKWLWATAVFLGIALGTKYTNVLLGIILVSGWLVWRWQMLEKPSVKEYFQLKKTDWSILILPVVSLIVFVALWPAMWLHPAETIHNILAWSAERSTPAVEYYFGQLQPVPWHYYLGSLLVTTPVVVLLLLGVGSYYLYRSVWQLQTKPQPETQYTWRHWLILFWLLLPLLQSLYPLRQNGIRYVIMLYPALALVAGYGLVRLSQVIQKINEELPYYLWTSVIGVLLLSLYFIYPYYLDYYNFLTGGNTRVYNERLFELAGWGQGQREAFVILSKVARPGSTVGLAVIPDYVAPNIPSLPTGIYDGKYEFEYVVTNATKEFRSDIKTELQQKGYVPVHYVKAGGAPIVTIYAKKTTGTEPLLPLDGIAPVGL